jgi:hypothetical protein
MTREQKCYGLAARHTWQDAKLAVDLLEQTENDGHIKILWVAVVTLLRTIGDVLNEVDAEGGTPELQTFTKDQYRFTIKNDPLFTDFIKSERDNLVHRYQFGVEATESGIFAFGGGTDDEAQPFMCDFLIIASGRFAGEDGRDMAREALAWWDARLVEVEKFIEEQIKSDVS